MNTPNWQLAFFVMCVFVSDIQVGQAETLTNETSCVHLKEKPSVDQIKEMLLENDEGDWRIENDNSRVCISTLGLKRVIELDKAAIPSLMRILDSNNSSFDLFTRAYSAIEQIIRRNNINSQIYWSGGCSVTRLRGGGFRIETFGQIDEQSFRKRVILSIQKETMALVGSTKARDYQDQSQSKRQILGCYCPWLSVSQINHDKCVRCQWNCFNLQVKREWRRLRCKR